MKKKHGLRPHEQRALDQASNAAAMQSAPKQEGATPEPTPAKHNGKRRGKK